ncbi:glycine cleavage system protein R [Actinomycetota bacterium]
MGKLVLTAIGDDRRGLVAALAQAIADHDGSWLEGQLARLGGRFAGIVLIELPDAQVEALTAALHGLDDEGLLEVSIMPAEPEEYEGGGESDVEWGDPLSLHLLGRDRPGIVSEVSTALADLGASIDELVTSTQDAPMGDGAIFEADAIVWLPEGTTVADLRHALEQIAHELMVDIEVAEPL